MIEIIKTIAIITHVPHQFSMKHIFLEVNTDSLPVQKKFDHLGETKFNELKEYVILENSKHSPIRILHNTTTT